VKAELAFILHKPLVGPNFDVLEATEFVTLAIEIMDTWMFSIDAKAKGRRAASRVSHQ
jgi:2-keto-4-pentenoate hydratase